MVEIEQIITTDIHWVFPMLGIFYFKHFMLLDHLILITLEQILLS